MSTVRNLFDLIYYGRMFSYCVYEQVYVRKRTLKEIAANCDTRELLRCGLDQGCCNCP